jgi:hypothetical protein
MAARVLAPLALGQRHENVRQGRVRAGALNQPVPLISLRPVRRLKAASRPIQTGFPPPSATQTPNGPHVQMTIAPALSHAEKEKALIGSLPRQHGRAHVSEQRIGERRPIVRPDRRHGGFGEGNVGRLAVLDLPPVGDRRVPQAGEPR